MLVSQGAARPVGLALAGATRPRLAVVMPAFNEEGLPEFLAELEAHLAPAVASLAFVVIDDLSETPVAELLRAAGLSLRSEVTVIRNLENLGHGPSALRAYRSGVATGADLVLHVDGDGQFEGADAASLVNELWEHRDADGAVGLRASRRDPWFRKVLTGCARTLVSGAAGPVVDANSPLRVYRRDVINDLLQRVKHDATVPHLQFSVLERRSGLVVREQLVTHRVRRGTSEVGTTWQGRPRRLPLPSKRLMVFSWHAASELLVCMRATQQSSDVTVALSAAA